MNAPLRVALIAPNRFPIREPFAGGLEAHVWHLAGALADEGHRVTLFAERGSGPFDDRVTVCALRRSDAASRPFPIPGAVFESDHHAYGDLMTELSAGRARDFDVIHNHSLHQVPIAMAARLHTPMLSTLHTPPFSWLESAIGAAGSAGVTFAAVSRHTAAAWSRVIGPVITVPQRCRRRPVAGRPRRPGSGLVRPNHSGEGARTSRSRRRDAQVIASYSPDRSGTPTTSKERSGHTSANTPATPAISIRRVSPHWWAQRASPW